MATISDRRSVTRTASMIPIQDVLRVVDSVQASDAGQEAFDAEPLVGVYGLRTFTLDRGTLRPVFDWNGSTAWGDGTCIAECNRGERHQVPADGCTCGVYSFRDLNRLRQQYSQSAAIVGVVALEGRVVEGVSGWRAQAARLVALWERTPGVVHGLPGVKRCGQLEDMVRAYPGLSVAGSSKSGASRYASPWPVLSPTSLSGPVPGPVLLRPVAASPTPSRRQRSVRRTPSGVAIALLGAVISLAIVVFTHGPVVLIGIVVILAIIVGPEFRH
ncbi:hypothetical protein F3087_19175 [Nocardia colli]|uniref:Uncharacterized protein n=1 Tax=Nocardia colli TaxID=2545717 RepID=A0A5N0EDN3_9NOCA|nr:hypothetical protein [Nocardia colli]KAA8887043.1 hypothetical protein F3087_19175 [Nocardia colli]